MFWLRLSLDILAFHVWRIAPIINIFITTINIIFIIIITQHGNKTQLSFFSHFYVLFSQEKICPWYDQSSRESISLVQSLLRRYPWYNHSTGDGISLVQSLLRREHIPGTITPQEMVYPWHNHSSGEGISLVQSLLRRGNVPGTITPHERVIP